MRECVRAWSQTRMRACVLCGQEQQLGQEVRSHASSPPPPRPSPPHLAPDRAEEDMLPSPSVTTSGNTRTVTEYYKNDKGEPLKRTTKTKIVNVEKKVYKVRAAVVPHGCPHLSSSKARGDGSCTPRACVCIRPLRSAAGPPRSRRTMRDACTHTHAHTLRTHRPGRTHADGGAQVAQERRQWERFGAAARETPQDSVTVQVGRAAGACVGW